MLYILVWAMQQMPLMNCMSERHIKAVGSASHHR